MDDATTQSWLHWSRGIADGIAAVSDDLLSHAAKEISASSLVLTAGNGGSSSLASHAAQAVAKPSYGPGGGRAAVCLTDHVPLLTAHTNDGGWASALMEAARPLLDAVPKCVLLVFSSSGKSENVIQLAQLAVNRHAPVIAFTGFAGYPLRALASISIHVDSNDYEVVEPVHDALIHRIQYHLRRPRAPRADLAAAS